MKLKNYDGTRLSERDFDTAAFGEKVLYRTLKDAVVMYQANQRQGTAKTKGRAEIAGSHKKPWKQKHTGRARAGDRKSPIWRGGGTVFGPVPRDYSYHMPAKARRVALRSALCGKLRDGEVVLIDASTMSAPSAKTARKLLKETGAMTRAAGELHKVLIVLRGPNENAWKSFRNFPDLAVRTAADLCAFDVVSSRLVLAESAALEAVAARVGVEAGGAA